MESLELNYSRGKLIRLALLSLVMTAVALWIALGGVSQDTARRGPGAWLGRLLGPDGLPLFGGVLAAVTLLFALLYLRRAFADPVAARADTEGLTVNTVFGSHFYAAEAVERLELHFPAGQPILQVIPVPGRGKMRGLAVNGLAETVDEVERWTEAVRESWASARQSPR